ncbi:hypothetical protein ACQEVX_04920 [Streptomyces syringium]|uniref:hypothetical protein n=1 Tax=Streptomyces syringium TaxID=76729 RepID=UPI003D89EBF4
MQSEADPKRVRVEIESRDDYRIMWLAGVRQVDLTQHCLKSFGFCDRPRVNHAARRQTVFLSAVRPPLAWYLCALPIPWDWHRNAHLAFEHAPGHSWEGDALVRGLGVRLTNARPIFGWGEHSVPLDAELRRSSRYRTCRNWQFAHWLRANRGAPLAPPLPTRPPAQGGDEQLAIM